MPIDARISMGLRPQTYDAFAAYDTGRQNEQTFRTNQMAQQTAQATAARNTMVRQRAAQVDYNDPASVNMFVREVGPDATPYLEAAGAGDTLFNTRAAETRAGGEYARKARGEDQGFMQRAIGAVYTDPSDANIAAVAAQAVAAGIPQDQMDAYVARIVAAPVEQRRSLLANELATSPEGLKLLERFTPAYDMQNAGGAIVPVQTNQLAPGATPPRPIAVTADPTKYTDIPTADGNITRVYADGRSEILRGPTGAPLTPAPTPAAERRQERREERAAAAERAASDALSKANIALDTVDLAMDSTNWATAGLAGTLDWVPGSPPKRLAGYLNTIRANVAFNELQQMRRNSPTGGALGNVSNADMSLLQSTLATLDQQASPEDLRRALATIKRVTEAVRDAYAQDVRDFGVEAMGGSAPAPAGGADMPPVGARGATLTNSQTGATFVSDGTRWVPR